jgi:peptide-methionine (S)-S-oxide reductase
VTKDILEKATFAAGCFWGVEAAFRKIKGVKEIQAGYTGGNIKSPTYEQVCTGSTGHAEAIEILFDPKEISYEKLLEIFWEMHDPTTYHRQGPDVGSQYRSAIFTHSARQAELAEKSKKIYMKQLSKPIVTEIVPAGPFYRAEEHHQRYHEKHGGSCSF